jgi:putative transposase
VRSPVGMHPHPYPTDLTDAAGDLLNDLIPPPQPGGRRRARDRRAVVKALCSLVDGGMQWRLLPQAYPQWPRVDWYCRPWRDSGDGHRLQETRRAQVRQPAGRHQPPTAGGLDSPSVQTPARGGERGDESGQQGQGRTRPLLVETLGRLLAVVVTAASVSDPAGARLLCARRGGACTTLRRIGGDGTSRGPLRAWVAQQRRCIRRVTVRPAGGKGVVLLPRRGVVENSQL